jgi:inner membrane protein
MPTFITHAIIGIAGASVVSSKETAKRVWPLSLICSCLPDADVIGFLLDVPYEHALGHRGFFHSLTFALLMGIGIGLVFFRDRKVFSQEWWLLTGYFFVLTASHGLLDCLTRGGFGIALLAPFDNSRYEFWWQPFEAAPLGISRWFTSWGFRVIKDELVWIWIPLSILVYWIHAHRRRVQETTVEIAQ